MSDEIFGSALAGASGDGGGGAGAMPGIGRGRTLDGHGGRAKPLTRFWSGTLSLTDPMEPPPLVVTERNDGWKATLDLVRLSRHAPTQTYILRGGEAS
jgi:hypothetical protein